MSERTCTAALNIAGEHFECDMQHRDGPVHSNRASAAIWTGATKDPTA